MPYKCYPNVTLQMILMLDIQLIRLPRDALSKLDPSGFIQMIHKDKGNDGNGTYFLVSSAIQLKLACTDRYIRAALVACTDIIHYNS